MPQCQISSSAHFFLYITINLSILTSFVIPKSPNGFSLQLIHRDSPHSPFYLKNPTDSQRISRFVETSNSKPNSKLDTNPQGLRVELVHNDRINYLVKINFGNPAVPLYFLPDTGSHLFWTQCEPCTHRYHQLPPIYNSSASRNYLKLPCEHPFCKNNSTFKCQRQECVYRLEYMGGSTTEGVVASDLFQPSYNTEMQIYFGCSRNNQNFRSLEKVGKVGGILGLNMSPVSLLQQLANITQRRFSYCLPPYSTQGNGSSLLRFGDDIITRGRRFKSTPIVSPPNQYLYYLNLRDISVEGRRLNFPPNTFALKRDGTGGCVIDSGTSFTHIIQPAYRQVLGAFQAYFDSYKLQRVHPPNIVLELCYKNSEKLPKFASMTYHFEGADFEVESHYIYRKNPRDPNVFCVELFSSQHLTVLGEMHQINTRVIYDASARQIFFSPEDCEHDR